MNSLEFINIEIKVCESDYERYIKWGETEFAISKGKRLKYLRQIKSELEAWGTIKGNLVLNDETSTVKLSVCYRTKNYNKIKKALEVKENDNSKNKTC